MPGRGVGREEIHDATWGEHYPHPTISALMPLIALMAVFAVVLLSYQLWEWSLPSETMVPAVAGLKQAEARQRLARAGLRTEIAPYALYSEGIPEGDILSSDPEGGRRVKQGRTVKLTLSKGSSFTVVPDVRELSLADARMKLAQAQLTVASENFVYNDKIANDRIIDLAPKPGAKLQRFATVTLQVSKGKEAPPEPDYAGGNLHTSTISVDLPKDVDGPATVRIDVLDDSGRNTVYEREHNPGDTVTYTIQGEGETQVEVYFADRLILTRKL